MGAKYAEATVNAADLLTTSVDSHKTTRKANTAFVLHEIV